MSTPVKHNLHICFLFLLYTMLNDVHECTSTNSFHQNAAKYKSILDF